MYKIVYYKRCDLELLKPIWLQLQQGDEMTYYQTFDWYKMVVRMLPMDCNKFESGFALLMKDDAPKLIFPYWIIKKTFRFINKPAIYFMGREGWSDYLNCVYNSIAIEDVKALFDDISQRFSCQKFIIEDLRESSTLYKVITKNYIVSSDIKATCVELTLPDNEEEYKHMLSKSSKQNIRTANNRLIKDGYTIRFTFDDKTISIGECEKLRAIRMPKKMGNQSIAFRIKSWIYNKLIFSFPQYLPFYEDTNSHVMTAFIDKELVAFFNYGIDVRHRRINVMSAGTSEKYGWYSPGILLMFAYIQERINCKDMDIVDFTRGNEKYKYSLGGHEHYNHKIEFHI